MDKAEKASVTPSDEDISALARGGRTNVIGFFLRLAARLPFLFIAGRVYGAEALGRYAYAILVIEFVAQIATLGLKRGLAEQLSGSTRSETHIVWDALLVSFLASGLCAAVLILFPQVMFPNSEINGLDRFLPLVILAWAPAEIALAAQAYRYDVAATVRARAIVEPWTISIAAGLFAIPWLPFFTLRDGLILSYVVAMVAALVAALWPMFRTYGWPSGWRPNPIGLARLMKQNMPLAAAEAAEWGSRRLDLAILGLFVSPAIVGVYYVAQQVASLPQKFKTSFDPILGPVITKRLAEGNKPAIARQVAQVGFWIIAIQVGIALSLGIPGEAVMGLVGPNFVGGTAALAFLLAAEAIAATAVVSEAALVYIARHRNLIISLSMLAMQAGLTFAFLEMAEGWNWPPLWKATGAAAVLALSLAYASLLKGVLLSRLLGKSVNGWRWAIAGASAVAILLGWLAIQLPEWAELIFGIPVILASYGWIIWRWGFGPEDRELFRL